jgi:hypothetical protein
MVAGGTKQQAVQAPSPTGQTAEVAVGEAVGGLSRGDLIAALTGVFLLLYALRPLVLFPSTIMGLASGMTFGPLLGWLRDRIHVHGMRYRAPELCERVTGRALSHEPFLEYLDEKLVPLYGL